MNVGISAGLVLSSASPLVYGQVGEWSSCPKCSLDPLTAPEQANGIYSGTYGRPPRCVMTKWKALKSGVSSAIDGTCDAVLSVLTGGKHRGYSPQEHAFKVASGMAFGGLNSMISPVSGSLSKTKVSQLASQRYIPGVSERGFVRY